MLHPQSNCKNPKAFRCSICCPDLHSSGEPTVYQFVQNLPVSDLEHPGSDEIQVKLLFASVIPDPRIVLRYSNISSNGPVLIHQAMVLEEG